MAKFGYTSKKQVKVKKPKPPKFGYTSKSQVKVTKPPKQRTEGAFGTMLLKQVLFEVQADKLTVLNPETKHRIKVTSALKYPHEHPAFKAAAALLKKKNITLPPNVHAVKKGEQIPLFNLKPYEDPKRAALGRAGSALSGDGAVEHLKETQHDFLDKMSAQVQDSIATYCGNGYTWLNAYLRGFEEEAYERYYTNEMGDYGEDETEVDSSSIRDSFDDAVYNMDKAFEQPAAILQDDVLVYRGIQPDSGLLEEIQDGGVGTIIEDGGFVSTSTEISVAQSFGAKGYNEDVVLKVIAKKGTRAIYPQAINMGLEDERELILNRGTKMRVLAIDQEKYTSKVSGRERIRHILTVETVLDEETK